MLRDFHSFFSIETSSLLQGGGYDANSEYVRHSDEATNAWKACDDMRSLGISYAGILLLDIISRHESIEGIRLVFDSKDRGCHDGMTFVCLCIESAEIALINGEVCDDQVANLLFRPFCEAIQENDFLANLFAQSNGSLIVKRDWIKRFIGQAVVDGAEVCKAIAEQSESGLNKLVFH